MKIKGESIDLKKLKKKYKHIKHKILGINRGLTKTLKNILLKSNG